MITRRDWMRAAACALALPCLPAALRAAGVDRDAMLGVQLWSVKDALATDPEGTLHALAALGFRRVEAAGWLGRGPDGFRRAVEGAGMRCDSAHFGMEAIAADMRGVAAQARDAGCRYLMCAAPLTPVPLPPNVDWMHAIMRAMTLDAWKHNAQLLNEAAAAAAAAGLKLGYHNHVAEFATYQGQRGYEVLLAETEPSLVKFELDVAWAVAGGQDPVALIDRLRARIVRLHLKDVRTKPVPGTLADDFDTVTPGGGVIDWTAVLRAALAAHIEGAYLEVEAPYRQSPLEDLAAGRRHLEKTLAAL